MLIKHILLGLVLVSSHCFFLPSFPAVHPTDPITAVCSLSGVKYDTIFGRIVFTQVNQHSPVRVFSNTVRGLGNYFTKCDTCKHFAVHITNLGDTSLRCSRLGGTFDPEQVEVGLKAGEVANLEVCADPSCHKEYGRLKGRVEVVTPRVSLFQGSPQNIVGLGCVVYDQPLGSDKDPKAVACGQVSLYKYDSALVS